MAVRIVDLDARPDYHGPVGEWGELVVGRCCDPQALADGEQWLNRAALTVVDFDCADRRTIVVDDCDIAVARLREQIGRHPLAAQVCDDVLRANAQPASVIAGLTVESLAYSTLQGGPEFARWLHEQPPRMRDTTDPAVLIGRDDDGTLSITFNRPDRHNAFSNAIRTGLLDGLAVALADPSITACVIRGAGTSFCSGGDLREFGLFSDVASSHIARTRHSPALALDAVASRLGAGLIAQVHGAVLGSGLEMACYCGTVRADEATVFGLPELGLGLIPGAGGTVSVTRRIGRWRTAYLVLGAVTVGAAQALQWGLVDDVVPVGRPPAISARENSFP